MDATTALHTLADPTDERIPGITLLTALRSLRREFENSPADAEGYAGATLDSVHRLLSHGPVAEVGDEAIAVACIACAAAPHHARNSARAAARQIAAAGTALASRWYAALLLALLQSGVDALQSLAEVPSLASTLLTDSLLVNNDPLCADALGIACCATLLKGNDAAVGGLLSRESVATRYIE